MFNSNHSRDIQRVTREREVDEVSSVKLKKEEEAEEEAIIKKNPEQSQDKSQDKNRDKKAVISVLID